MYVLLYFLTLSMRFVRFVFSIIVFVIQGRCGLDFVMRLEIDCSVSLV